MNEIGEMTMVVESGFKATFSKNSVQIFSLNMFTIQDVENDGNDSAVSDDEDSDSIRDINEIVNHDLNTSDESGFEESFDSDNDPMEN